MSSAPTIAGLNPLRPAPDGMPDPIHQPPNIAESGDPFASTRIIHLVACIERGRAIRIADLVDRLNAMHLDWLFDGSVVTNTLLQLQANWMADYRNSGGVILDEGALGTTVTIEDSTRVDPWIVRQALRADAQCVERLADFGRRDRATGEG